MGLKPSPAVQLHLFPGKKDASAYFTREEKGCVDTFREYVRPPLVASPPHRIPAFRTHSLGMSGTTLPLDGQKEVHILLCANHFVGGFLLAAYGEQKCMVAKGAGRRPCPLFGIRGVRFSGVHNVLLLR